jgi:hypothetical protein
MMNWNFTTTTLAATVLAVPAMTLAPQAQDLRSSLGETMRALEALTGLAPRCVMIGTLTAGQFALFDTVMDAVGAQKFHFVDPSKGHH